MATRRQKAKSKDRKRVSARAMAKRNETRNSFSVFRTPDGYQQFEFKESGRYNLAVLPFTSTISIGDLIEEGDQNFQLTYHVHRNVGPSGASVLCMNRTFGKACLICDEQNKLRQAGADKETIKELYPQQRVLMWVYDLDNPEAGAQLLDTSYYRGLPEMISDELNECDDESFDFYWDPEEALMLRVSVKEEDFQGNKFMKVRKVEICERKGDVPEDVYADLPALETLLIQPTEAQVKAAYFAEPSDDEDEDEEDEPTPRKRGRPAKSSTKRKPVEDDEEDDEEEEEDEEPTPRKRGRPAKTSTKRKPVEDDDEDEDEDEDDEEDEPTPRKRGRPAKTSTKRKPVDEDEEDEPTPRKRGRPAKTSTKRKPVEDDDEDEDDEEDLFADADFDLDDED